MSLYDDNFGHWDRSDDDDTRNFYAQVQRTNVLKVCAGCKRKVRIQAHYAYCDACADAIERGGEF